MKVRSVRDVLTLTSSGLYCAAGDFYLDPRRSVHRAVVTHAHADHAVRNNGHVICTQPTKRLMQTRYGNRLLTRFQVTDYHQPVTFNDVRVTLLPAGHMLGSAQVLVTSGETSVLYTGDFKTQDDATSEPFATASARVLVTETTFAHPDYSHPDPLDEIKRLDAIDGAVVIGAYAMGKAQRVSWLVHAHCPDRRVFVHPDIARYHDVYRESGMSLGEWQPYRRQTFLETPGAVLVAPPGELARHARKPGVTRLFATGWKKAWMACDGVLRISDHADWNNLLEVIGKVGPEEIYTLHGDGSHLKHHLEGSGVPVHLLGR
jgi:putative mRNA 3-end processing factor